MKKYLPILMVLALLLLPAGASAAPFEFGFISIELPFVPLVDGDYDAIAQADLRYNLYTAEALEGDYTIYFFDVDETELSLEAIGAIIDAQEPGASFLAKFEDASGRDLPIPDGDLASLTTGRIEGRPAMSCTLARDKSLVIIAATFDTEAELEEAIEDLDTLQYLPD